MPKQVSISDVKIQSIQLYPDGNNVICTVQYDQVDDSGRKYSGGTMDIDLTTPQENVLKTFVGNVIIPVIKATEGI